MRNYERRMIRGREIEFRWLTAEDFRRGNVRYQVWTMLPNGRQVLVGETANRTWAITFVRMIPIAIDGHEIKVLIVESNGSTHQTVKPAMGRTSAFNHSLIHDARLKLHQGGRIDWTSYGRED